MLQTRKGLFSYSRFREPTAVGCAGGTEAPAGQQACRFVFCWIGLFRSGYDFVRSLLAALLLVAAALKGYQLATEPTVGTGLLETRWFLMCVVEFELFFGLWLFSGLLPRLTWAAALGCFGLFSCISLYKAIAGYTSCGCFGSVQVNPWYTFTLDAAVVLALLWWRPRGLSPLSPKVVLSAARDLLRSENASLALPVAPAMAVLLLWLLVGVPAAVAMGSYRPAVLAEDGVILGEGNLVVLEPGKWIGKPFPLLRYIEDIPGSQQVGRSSLRERLAKGEWIVVLYHDDCPKCQEAIPKYQRLARDLAGVADAPRVALLEIPPDREKVEGLVHSDSPCVLGRLRETKAWFCRTPVEMQLSGGAVVQVVGGEEPQETGKLAAR